MIIQAVVAWWSFLWLKYDYYHQNLDHLSSSPKENLCFSSQCVMQLFLEQMETIEDTPFKECLFDVREE